jgi:hypothetical protein
LGIKHYSQTLDVVSGVIVLSTGGVELVDGFTGATEDDVTARTCELVEGFPATAVDVA